MTFRVLGILGGPLSCPWTLEGLFVSSEELYNFFGSPQGYLLGLLVPNSNNSKARCEPVVGWLKYIL